MFSVLLNLSWTLQIMSLCQALPMWPKHPNTHIKLQCSIFCSISVESYRLCLSSKPYPLSCDQTIPHIKLRCSRFCSISVESYRVCLLLSLTHVTRTFYISNSNVQFLCKISIEATAYVFHLSHTHFQIYPPGNEKNISVTTCFKVHMDFISSSRKEPVYSI